MDHRACLPLLRATALCLVAGVVAAAEPVDLDAVNRIRAEGLHRSQVMDHAWQLTEGNGPRLTGSPGHRSAAEWSRDLMASWGMAARLEEVEFGHGWTFERSQVRMVAPYAAVLEALPKAWTPGTAGAVRGRVVQAKLASAADLESWRGKLAGAVVLLEPASEVELDGEMFSRYDAEELAGLVDLEIPGDRDRDGWRKRFMEEYEFWPKLAAFLTEEGVVAMVEPSSRDHSILRVYGGGTSGQDGRPEGVPHLTMVREHYNRLVRLLERGREVELELDVATTFHRDRATAPNVIAELPGTDLAGQVVMVGAHLDSWHAGTGATDNGGNCAVVMEAVRILGAAGLAPRRTIRVALWMGEEQGFIGSRAFVERHLATRPETSDPEQLALPKRMRETTWPIEPLPGHGTVSAYFNLDFGSGRIRGIFAEENVAVAPVFGAWMETVRDLGATTVSPTSVGGTDHVPFNRAGVPGYQFIQDGMDYMTRTHHTDVDTYDHLVRDDLVQASTVLATFLWHAATRDELLPRKPMPQKPPETPKEERPATP